MKRLKFDNKTIEIVSTLVNYHYITPIDDKVIVKKLLSKVGEMNFLRLIEVIKGDCRAKERFCLETLSVLDEMKRRMYEIKENSECFSKSSLCINGNDVMEAGFKGREISETLDGILELVIEEKLPNDRKELLKAVYDKKAKNL